MSFSIDITCRVWVKKKVESEYLYRSPIMYCLVQTVSAYTFSLCPLPGKAPKGSFGLQRIVNSEARSWQPEHLFWPDLQVKTSDVQPLPSSSFLMFFLASTGICGWHSFLLGKFLKMLVSLSWSLGLCLSQKFRLIFRDIQQLPNPLLAARDAARSIASLSSLLLWDTWGAFLEAWIQGPPTCASASRNQNPVH